MLEADLREYYGLRLPDYYDGLERPTHVAACAASLPRGARVWRYFGGGGAITDETEALWLVERAVFAQNAKNPAQVKVRDYPEGLKEQSEHEEHFASQAEAWRAKQRAKQEQNRDDA